jgi:hypothetical protein
MGISLELSRPADTLIQPLHVTLRIFCFTFLCAFAKEVRKATISFDLPVCLSISPFVRFHMEELGSHWTEFYSYS